VVEESTGSWPLARIVIATAHRHLHEAVGVIATHASRRPATPPQRRTESAWV
jgi:hypothetical protein